MNAKTKVLLLIQFFFLFNFNLIKSQNTTIHWECLGPTEELLRGKWKHIGRVESVWVNPKDISEIYIGSNSAGLWKTTDGGENWVLMTKDFTFGVQDIEVDTVNNFMYIATGIYANSLLANGGYGKGIYKSEDWGKTWKPLQNFDNTETQYMRRISISANRSVLFALSRDKLYKSSDYGKTWDVVLKSTNSDEGFKEMAQNPKNSNEICVTGIKCFYTTNNALSENIEWKNRYLKISDSVDNKLWCDAEYSDSGILWINACRKKTNLSDIIKSEDNGQTLIRVIKNKPLGGIFGATVGIKVVNDSLIYTAGGTMYRVEINKKKIKRITEYWGSNTHADIRDVCIPLSDNKDVIFIVTDGGVNRTLTGGKGNNEWERIYGNLSLLECYTVSVSEQDTEIMFTNTHDNGGYKRFSDGTWDKTLSVEGGTTAINKFNDSIMFATIKINLYKSTDRGNKWRSNKITTMHFDSPVVQHPTEEKTFYLSTNKGEKGKVAYSVYETKDNGNSWHYYTSPFKRGYATAIGISPVNPDFKIISYYMAWSGKNYDIGGSVTRYNEKTKKWEDISENINKLSEKIVDECLISEIEMHTKDAKKAWISFGRFLEKNKIYETSDYGLSWDNISYDIPNIPVNNIKYYEEGDILFAATDIGLLFLSEASKNGEDCTWERYGDFPNLIASDIKIVKKSKQIVVATYGGGIWRADLTSY